MCGLAETVLAIGSGGTVSGAGAASGGLTASIVAGAGVVFATRNVVAVPVGGALSKMTGVQAGISRSTKPVAGTLFDEITG